MKKSILGGLAVLLIFSCTQNADILSESNVVSTPTSKKSFSALLQTPNKESVKDLVENGNTKTRSTNGNEYVSLMDVVKEDDPLLDTLSLEDRNAIKENALTYYEAFGYEDIIPNEAFAKLLNSRAEIQVGDSVYRVTQYGTLVTTVNSRHLLEDASNLLNKGGNLSEFGEKVKLVGSYNNVDLVHAGSIENVSGVATRTTTENIPYNTFPQYSSESHTFVGKILGRIFGDRSVKHHNFMKGYRIKGSLYDYDYGVYSEVGTFVASRKKRGGFFKKINGWKGTNAEELSITYQGIVLELDLKIPSNIQFPKQPTAYSAGTANLPGIEGNLPCLDIFGLSITKDQVIKIAGQGLKMGLQELRNLLGNGVDGNTRALRIFTPDKTYFVIMDNQINRYNTDELRKVFNAQVKFYISSTMITNPLSVKSAIDFVRGAKSLPVKRMVAGQVILAGKINGRWGGMIITKKIK